MQWKPAYQGENGDVEETVIEAAADDSWGAVEPLKARLPDGRKIYYVMGVRD